MKCRHYGGFDINLIWQCSLNLRFKQFVVTNNGNRNPHSLLLFISNTRFYRLSVFIFIICILFSQSNLFPLLFYFHSILHSFSLSHFQIVIAWLSSHSYNLFKLFPIARIFFSYLLIEFN